MDKYRDLVSGGGLSLDRLRNFCLIDEAGGLSKAARGDPGRMSLLSRQVRELEEFFGVKLTRKAGRTLQMTDAGRQLATIVRAHLDALQEFAATAKGQGTNVSIGAGNSVIEWLLVSRIPELRANLPLATVSIQGLRSRDLVQGLQNLTLDVGIVRKDAVPAGLMTTGGIVVSYALFVPMAMAEGLTPNNLPKRIDAIPVATSLGGQFRRHLDVAASRVGLNFQFTIGCSSFTQAARAVKTGQVAAILPDIAESDFDPTMVSKLPLNFLTAYNRTLTVAWNQRAAETRACVRDVALRMAESLK